MTARLPHPFVIAPQPDDRTCGPTCLYSVYGYYGDQVPLEEVIREVPQLDSGGTLGVHLANHALRRGYRATIYTYNLHIYDPTWFAPGVDLAEKLRAQRAEKVDPRLLGATDAYLEFLERGGELRFHDLNGALIRGFLRRGLPILTGLSATYLYRCAREDPNTEEYDDVGGEPMGHFVVLCAYDRLRRSVTVADPLLPNPVSTTQLYAVPQDRLIAAILLGIVTYDANLLIIAPADERSA